MNKKCYAQLYAKLMTADIEREKNQVLLIDAKVSEWRSYALSVEITQLEWVLAKLLLLNKLFSGQYISFVSMHITILAHL